MLQSTKQMLDQAKLRDKIDERFTLFMAGRPLSWLLRLLGVETLLYFAFAIGFCEGGDWEAHNREQDEKRIFGRTIHN